MSGYEETINFNEMKVWFIFINQNDEEFLKLLIPDELNESERISFIIKKGLSSQKELVFKFKIFYFDE